MSDNLCIALPEFLNLFPLRAPRLMWFIGAGGSVSAGIPTAGTLTWEFKRAVYCATNKVPSNRFPDLNDAGFQTLVQSWFDSKSGWPPRGSDEEYSFYFEKYLPDERDRQRFVELRMRESKPSYGHICLAGLVALQKIQLIWTTNFDKLVERATAQDSLRELLADGIHAIGLDCPEKAADSLRDERWPVLVKVHGDYLFRKLKNTSAELSTQDNIFRALLTDHCGRRGLGVVGYSGRDQSIMDAIGESLAASQPFPHGLFWFVRLGEVPKDNVLSLLEKARGKGCQAGYIQIGSFDELMADLFMSHHDQLPAIRDLVKGLRGRKQPAPLTYEGRAWPVLRTNALEILTYPATCMVFKATIGKAKEVKELVIPHRERLTAGRRKAGVVAIGHKEEIEKVFEKHSPCEFDRYAIEPKKFRYSDSVEAGLFYDAMAQGISDATNLSRSVNRKGRMLYVEDDDVLDQNEARAFKNMFNVAPWRKVSKTGPTIHEGFQISIEFRDLRLWLILEPTIFVTTDGITPYVGEDRSDIGREDLAQRFNRKANSLLDFWIEFLRRRGGSPINISFPKGDQPEARFSISTVTAFARQKS